MCRFMTKNHLDRFGGGEHQMPTILQALLRLEQTAQNNYNAIQSCLEQFKEMEKILNKLVVTHFDSDNYVEYLFRRAEQLSTHLETYKKIISKIDIGEDIRLEYKKISFDFIEYLKQKIEFKSVWIDNMQIIESGRQTIIEKLSKSDQIRQSANDAFDERRYFDLNDLRGKMEEDITNLNEMVDNCFRCGQRSKELSTALYDKLAELESQFQMVVKKSMNKIDEIKSSSIIVRKHNENNLDDRAN
ncbi:hypothetical protein NH340_JMT06606 [Sarcoptes scabiei]|nr:hypothetical protein QR98_0016360 [Sarcoptes scabiei]UXI20663.1 hypothetical protein NH340_JMT06606 [Sarcoptes scabiei]